MNEQNTISEAQQQKAFEALGRAFVDDVKENVRAGENRYKLIDVYQPYDIKSDKFDTIQLDDTKAEKLAIVCVNLASTIVWLFYHRNEFKNIEFVDVVNNNWPKYQVRIQQALNNKDGALYHPNWYPLIKSLSEDCMPDSITKDRTKRTAIYVNGYTLVYRTIKSLKDDIVVRESIMKLNTDAEKILNLAFVLFCTALCLADFIA